MSVAAEICAVCGHAGIEARGFCPRCGSRDVALGAIDGNATIWSLTTIHRPPAKDAAADGPYIIGVVALAAGPRLMARLPNEVAIGDAVVVARHTLDGEPVITPKG